MAALVRREWTPSISGKRVEERRGVPSGITQDVKDYFESWAVSVVLERETGIEPATSSLGSWRSTAELLPLTDEQNLDYTYCELSGNHLPTASAIPRYVHQFIPCELRTFRAASAAVESY